MIHHYILFSMRNFWRNWDINSNRKLTFINLAGLAVGLSCVMLLTLYISDELSYDKHHKQYKRIYRLESDITVSDRHQQVAKSSFAIGPAFKREFPEVEEFVRFKEMDPTFFQYNDKEFNEEKVFFADSTIFSIFSYQFLEGTPEKALTEPNTVVLTYSMAKKYFGDDHPIDKMLNIGNGLNCKVTGVIEDIPANSHLDFDALISMVSYPSIIGIQMFNDLETRHFWAIRLFTYILLKEHTAIKQIYDKFPAFHDQYIEPVSRRLNGTFKLITHPLADIHLRSRLEWDLPTGNLSNIYIFSAIALFILLIAGVNYMNLATARSAQRGKEVGIRKVLGAHRNGLARQFLSESVVLVFLALIIALMIVETLLPTFNNFTGKELSLNFSESFSVYVILIGATLFIGLLSGSYPALFLSAFKPVPVLKGAIFHGRKSGMLRKILIVFQFTISITMIACTLIVLKQLDFIKSKDLGFDKEGIIIMHSTDAGFKQKFPVFRDRLIQNPEIYYVSTSLSIPGLENYMDVLLVEGEEQMEEQLMSLMDVDYDFIDLMGIEILQGRNFDRSFATDLQEAVIINQTAARKLGWGQEAPGKEIHRRSDAVQNCKVIGVVKDFHFQTLHEEIGPISFFLSSTPQDYINVKINPGRKEELLVYLEKTWKEFNPGEPFIYSFLDEVTIRAYGDDKRMFRIISLFALLSIFISLLGLLGLSSFITEQYSRDVGIRKVLGASTESIILLFTKNYLFLILISFIIATPIAWYVMDRWLQHFAYHLDIKVVWLIMTGIGVIILAGITVIVQILRTARTNPVEVLRYE